MTKNLSKNLDDWLNWQQSLNPKEIDLGLDRVSRVLSQLNLSGDFFCPVISVAGTNGKGSTVAIIESILHQSAISVGCYTSPHLLKYNERIRINQQPVSDQVLCEAFEVIDQARGDIELTYFEFGTLAALLIFNTFNVEVAVLEVGLGGRLDAVNVINADVAIISSISIDHTDWLGDDIEGIAREKAGIMRGGKTAVLASVAPQQALLDYAHQLNTSLICLGKDYLYQGLAGARWQLKGSARVLHDLPAPVLQGHFQMQNAAAAIMALEALLPERPAQRQDGATHPQPSTEVGAGAKITRESIARGLQQIQLQGRFQIISHSPQVVVDVAHNEASAKMLREQLRELSVAAGKARGRTLAVVAMLSDKAIAEVLEALNPEINQWFSAGLSVTGSQRRAMQPKNMAQAVRELHADVRLTACETVREACEKARMLAQDNDRIIVFGSFYTVAEALVFFNSM
ncbi:Dihydrofolate synthase @ Folylpolyglutamate synthase [hydrothermal vent metagenome]|uniref:Dihydrofolate synthase @ Folylpolyglutamate synthase n=1 Tax=hydrothermal vent metagenome TaxID=652676 RepID=A0A3B0XZ75_9ZZZZ